MLSGRAGNLMETWSFPLDYLSPAFSPVIPPSSFEQSFFVCLFVFSFNFLAAPRSMLDLTSLPDQGLYPWPLQQKLRALTPGPSGKSLNKLFYFLECEVEEVSHNHKQSRSLDPNSIFQGKRTNDSVWARFPLLVQLAVARWADSRG